MTFDTKEFVRRDFLSRHYDAQGNELRSFYSLRKNAWHFLGQVVEKPASDPRILELSGLAWMAERMGLYTGEMDPVDTHVAIRRSDTKAILGVVSSSYQTVQNHELLAWMRSFEKVGNVIIETAGALMDGSTVWVQGRVEGLRFDIKGDAFDNYISMTNGHGGNRKLMLTPTVRRQECNNSTRAIVAQKRKQTLATGYELRHSRLIHANMDDITRLYAGVAEAFKHTQEVLTYLASKPLSEKAIGRVFQEVWYPKAPETTEAEPAEAAAPDESERASVIRAEREGRLRSILASKTCQHPGTKDTLFSLFNCVTEYLEFESPARGTKGLSGDALDRSVDANRFESNLDGLANDRKALALDVLMEVAETA